MQIIVLADEAGRNEFNARKTAAYINVEFIENLSEISNYKSTDAFLLLKNQVDKADSKAFGDKPVLINSVINTLKELNLPDHFIRINGWAGFINRDLWEIATANEEVVKDIFERLKWKYITVADEPGLVSARIIAMIINEAYFALGENVSTKEEIDLAMKLGTNYPYGPFEWSQKIGLENVYHLLEKLSKTDIRYTVAPALKKEFNR
jgi:3-hydroxybutyryl-CoA dehydrogenase